MKGVVLRKLPEELFEVRLEDGKDIVAHVVRELRDVIVRVKPGDRVECVREANDPARGRIAEVRT